MRLKIGTSLLALLFSVQLVNAQNLVLNDGFENYITCPSFGQFGNSWVNDWYKPGWGSSDYYHFNCPGIVPSPGSLPKTGNAEAGIILFNYGTEYREYITATLSQPLVAGKNYYVEFYLALNPGYIQAIKEAGAYMSDSVPGPYLNALSIPLVPQVKNNGGFISYGWNKISGNFTASGGEKYMTIGNFNNDSNTTTSMVGNIGSYGSYYFVDDVYLGATDSVPQAIDEDLDSHFFISPNPVSSNGPLYINQDKNVPFIFDLYNQFGCQISRQVGTESKLKICLNDLPPGFYYYKITGKRNGCKNGKLLLVR